MCKLHKLLVRLLCNFCIFNHCWVLKYTICVIVYCDVVMFSHVLSDKIIILFSLPCTYTRWGLVCAYWCYYSHWLWTGLCWPVLLLLALAADWFVLNSVTIACTSCGLVCADQCYYYSHWLWMGLCGLVYADHCYFYYLHWLRTGLCWLVLLLLLTLAADWFVLTGVTTTTYTGCGLVCADRRVILCFSRSTDIAKRWWACSCLNSSAAPIAAQKQVKMQRQATCLQ